MPESKVLPCFKTHYSICRSILTLEDSPKKPNAPVSALQLAKEAELSEVVLVEDSFSGFLEALKNSKSLKLKLVFGLRLFLTESIKDKTPDAVCKRSKIVIFVKNTDGYNDLCRIWSLAASEGLFSGRIRESKTPHIDYANLERLWTKNLKLVIPFYDSFLHMNVLDCGNCVPSFSKIQPVFFREDNDLPFDYILNYKLDAFIKDNPYEVIKAKSIFYENEEDFTAYLTMRCINNRSTLESPDLDHMCSNKFSFESWKEANNV